MNGLGRVLLVAVLLLCGACGSPDKTTPPSEAHAQQAGRDRIQLDMFAPDAALAKGWRVSVTATYDPVNYGDPGTTVTTESRSNCRQSRNVVFVPVPSFSKCKSTVMRSETRELPASQISLAGARSIAIDFAPLLKVRGSDYRIAGLYLKLIPCEQCEEINQELTTRCYIDERELEVLSNDFLLHYRKGSGTSAQTAECGLTNGDWYGWAGRESALARIRGYYSADESFDRSALLDSYGLIPTPDNGWVFNPTAKLNRTASDLCNRPPVQEYQARLKKSAAWPYDPQVEVSVTLDERGGICRYDLRGKETAEFTSSVRIVYVFIDGHLRQVETDEPRNLRRIWRWADDQPVEYIQRDNATSVAGSDEIHYWNKVAAQYWPKQMNYRPDFKAFDRQQAFIQELIRQYPPQIGKTP